MKNHYDSSQKAKDLLTDVFEWTSVQTHKVRNLPSEDMVELYLRDRDIAVTGISILKGAYSRNVKKETLFIVSTVILALSLVALLWTLIGDKLCI